MNYIMSPFSLLRFIIVMFLCVVAARAELPTQPADRFVDSIGVCTHWSYPDTPYGFAFEEVKHRLLASGIRHVRDGLHPRLVELGKLGIQATVGTNPDKAIEDTLAAIKKANAEGARIVAIEGPNEPDLFWKNANYSYQGQGAAQGDAGIIAGVIAFQKDLYAAAKADPSTRPLTVIGPSLGKTYGYDTKSPLGKGTLTESVDWGNFHPYPGGNPFTVPFPYAGVEKYFWQGGFPSANMDEHPFAFDIYGPPFAPKPMAATETGYSTFNDGPTEAAQAKYLPRLFCEYFRKGVQRTYSYEFCDEFNNPPDREANFGIIRYDRSPKPAYHALRRLIRLVEEPNAKPFTPLPLPASLSVKPANGFDHVEYVHHVALQRSDGTFLLLIWHDIALDDTSQKPWRRVPLAPLMPAALKLDKPVKHAEVFIPNDGDEVVQTFSGTDEILLGVPDRMMVVRMSF